jgi:hypothetical protein
VSDTEAGRRSRRIRFSLRATQWREGVGACAPARAYGFLEKRCLQQRSHFLILPSEECNAVELSRNRVLASSEARKIDANSSPPWSVSKRDFLVLVINGDAAHLCHDTYTTAVQFGRNNDYNTGQGRLGLARAGMRTTNSLSLDLRASTKTVGRREPAHSYFAGNLLRVFGDVIISKAAPV